MTFSSILTFELIMLIGIIILSQSEIVWAVQPTTITTTSPLVISTRGHFDPISGTLNTGHNETDYAFNNTSIFTKLQKEDCPNEITIVVHGWGL